MMAAPYERYLRASSTFKIPGFNSYKKLAIEKFVIQKQDVLVNLAHRLRKISYISSSPYRPRWHFQRIRSHSCRRFTFDQPDRRANY